NIRQRRKTKRPSGIAGRLSFINDFLFSAYSALAFFSTLGAFTAFSTLAALGLVSVVTPFSSSWRLPRFSEWGLSSTGASTGAVIGVVLSTRNLRVLLTSACKFNGTSY